MQVAGAAPHHQHMPVAVAVGPTLDGRVRGDRVGTRIALVFVAEFHRHQRL